MNAVSMHAFRRRALLPFRLAFTAFAFALFGLGGIVFGFFLTPWLKMAGGTPEEKKSLARRVVKRWFGLFVSVVTSLGLVRIEVKNPEAFQKKGAILAANHPSLIDIVCLLSIVPEATTIVKASLLKNWFTRAPILGAGYIPNDAGPEALVLLEAELSRGVSFVIFPEGTRTPIQLSEMPKMHRGTAQLALHANRPITPPILAGSLRMPFGGAFRRNRWSSLLRRFLRSMFRHFKKLIISLFAALPSNLPMPSAGRFSRICE